VRCPVLVVFRPVVIGARPIDWLAPVVGVATIAVLRAGDRVSLLRDVDRRLPVWGLHAPEGGRVAQRKEEERDRDDRKQSLPPPVLGSHPFEHRVPSGRHQISSSARETIQLTAEGIPGRLTGEASETAITRNGEGDAPRPSGSLDVPPERHVHAEGNVTAAGSETPSDDLQSKVRRVTAAPEFLAPSSTDDDRRRRRRVIAVGAGLYALSGPGQTAGFSVFVDPLTDAFGISRSQLTAAYLVATLAAAPAGFWIGRRLDRFQPSTMMRLVAAALAVSLIVTAAAPVLIVLAVGVFGLRAFGQSGLTLTSSVYVAKSITARRGAALGLLTAVGGSAIALTPLGASRLIPMIGWRQTWLVLAGIVAAGGFLLARAAATTEATRRAGSTDATDATDSTEMSGAEPRDGSSMVSADAGVSSGARRRQRWGFVVVAAGFATTAAIVTALAFHQVAVLGERGLSATAAATNFLPQSLAAATTAIVVGRLVDRVPGRVVVPINMMLLLAGLASLWVVQSPVTAVFFGVLMGTAAAANGASEGALLARWTGTATLGRMRGRLMALVVTSTAVSPLAFTLAADALGSFTRAATLTMLLPVGVALLALRAPLPNSSDMAEYAREGTDP
jgi:MFS family permease